MGIKEYVLIHMEAAILQVMKEIAVFEATGRIGTREHIELENDLLDLEEARDKLKI